MYRPIYSKCISQFCCMEKKEKGGKKEKGIDIHTNTVFLQCPHIYFLPISFGKWYRWNCLFNFLDFTVHLLFLRTWQILSLHNIPSTYNAKHFMTLLALGEEKMKHEIRNILAEQYSLTLVSLYTAALGKY